MSHWLLETLGDTRDKALKQASHAQINGELFNSPFSEDTALIRRTGEVLEMTVLDLILEGTADDETKLVTLRSCAADAFRLFRILPQGDDALEASKFKLRSSALAVLGDMGSDAARLLRESQWPELPLNSEDWSKRTWATIVDIWLRLIRKQGWTDRDLVLSRNAKTFQAAFLFMSSWSKMKPILFLRPLTRLTPRQNAATKSFIVSNNTFARTALLRCPHSRSIRFKLGQ